MREQLRFEDCTALCRLPWFERDRATGLPRLLEGVADDIVDAHTHLGWSYGLARRLRLRVRTPEVQHFFPERGVPVELGHYSAWDFPPEVARRTRRESVSALWTARGARATFTVPNLLAEMDRLGVREAVVLAIEMPILSRCTEDFLEATAGADRLHVFCSVHPFAVGNRRRVARAVARGACGMKLHPATQLVAPDHPRMLRAARLAAAHRLPVLFHTGASPIAPRLTDRLCRLARFERVVAELPETTFIFGHAGIDEYRVAMALARRYPNVVLELSGQPPARIREMIQELGPERLAFGSDWPFYPIALPLAKVLIATEDEPAARAAILAGTIRRIVAPLGRRRAEGACAPAASSALPAARAGTAPAL
ncbi:MAG: hypothetical protein KatS3mg102_0584 [Planctomycetota bacterium]|nr:MAG: hypothetical protein KatS3mg102_0584 [Planctomycetota bacterium]